jgi:sulfate permease
MIENILYLASVFIAINMGVSGFAISFTPSYGSGIIKRNTASFFYTIFVILGALLVGGRVVETLTTKLSSSYSANSGLIIILVSGFVMFLANILKIPQSTSFVTVGAFSGAAYYYSKSVNIIMLLKILFFAILFCVLAFFITYFIMKKFFYPPGPNNFRLYEKSFVHKNKIRRFILYTDFYSSFAVGTNNVANVVAPILLMFKFDTKLLLFIVGLFFGLGSLFFGKKVINSVSKEIIPIGEISAFIISFITASFVVLASILGLPTPYVQITTFSVLAISVVKDGFFYTFKKSIVKRIFYVWFLCPFLSFILSYLAHYIFGVI